MAIGPFIAGAVVAAPPSPVMLTSRRFMPPSPADGGQLTTAAISTCLAFATIGSMLGWSPVSAAFCYSAAVGVRLVVTDILVRRLPFAATGAMYAACAIAFGIQAIHDGSVVQPTRAVLAAAAILGASLLLTLALPGHLGLGDVVLLGWVAFSLGWWSWRSVLLGVFVGVTIQAFLALTMTRLKELRHRTLPMGPALMLGWLVTVVFFKGS